MNSRIFIIPAVVLCLVLLLAACGQPEPTPSPEPSFTLTPTLPATPLPATATPEAAPTATPVATEPTRTADGPFADGALKIATSYVFLDALDWMRQAGYWPIAPSLGTEMRWLPPATRDGVILNPQDNAVSQRTIERVLRMHAALGRYNGQPPTREVLDEMEMVKHWHPRFMWYGPAGIGTTRGLKAFEDYHQIPFLVAFPDRKGSDFGHFIRIGDGHYAVTGGWGYLQATHLGSDFLGIPATGKRLAMRVMDFYRCDDETIIENWVPLDIPHLLLQVGLDVFSRMRHQFRQHGPISVSDWMVRQEV